MNYYRLTVNQLSEVILRIKAENLEKAKEIAVYEPQLGQLEEGAVWTVKSREVIKVELEDLTVLE